MRAIAASSIVVYHVWLYGAKGQHGVDFGPATKAFDNLRAGVTLFFVLSGFLLFRPYVASALRGARSPSLGAYLRNRALRILPAYFFILLFVAVVLERELLRSPEQLAANLFFLQNYIPDYIFGPGIVPAWSLSIEVVFYLCLPVLGGIAIRLAANRGLNRVAAALVPVFFMALLGITSKEILPLFDGGARAVWALTFLTHADWFAVGMALAVARVLWEDDRFALPRWWRPVALAAAAVFAIGGMKLYYQGTLSYLEYQTPIAVGCGLILGLVVLSEPTTRLHRFLDWRPVFAAGLASYSLFLWHDPLVRAFRDAGLTIDGRAGFFVNLALIGVVAGIASTLTYRFVEKPALARKRSWQAPGEPSVRAEPVGAIEEGDLRPGSATPATR
jgi:peptidoglycan/LPS O-acetylase OafA/YrhL